MRYLIVFYSLILMGVAWTCKAPEAEPVEQVEDQYSFEYRLAKAHRVGLLSEEPAFCFDLALAGESGRYKAVFTSDQQMARLETPRGASCIIVRDSVWVSEPSAVWAADVALLRRMQFLFFLPGKMTDPGTFLLDDKPGQPWASLVFDNGMDSEQAITVRVDTASFLMDSLEVAGIAEARAVRFRDYSSTSSLPWARQWIVYRRNQSAQKYRLSRFMWLQDMALFDTQHYQIWK